MTSPTSTSGEKPSSSRRFHLPLIIAVAILGYIPFVNQAVHIDSDMLVTVARQLAIDPINPPLGDYGRHMVLHDRTQMPKASVYYRSHHPPLMGLLLAPVATIAGTAEWPYHVVYFFLYLLCILGAWELFGLVLGSDNRFNATLLFTVCPALMVSSHSIMWDVPVCGLMIWALVLFIRSLRTGRVSWLVASAVVTGLAGVTKVNSIALFVLLAGFLIWKRRWRWLLLWCAIASLPPVAWVVHNLIVFGKIQYLSSGQTSFLLSDVRYRIERIVSFQGGIVVAPVLLYWLIARIKKLRVSIVPFALFAVAWAALLLLVLHKPIAYAIAYAMFSCVGFWLIAESCFPAKFSAASRDDSILLAGFAILSCGVLLLLPSASGRYMLPLVPIAILVIVNLSSQLGIGEQKWFWSSALALTIPLSLSLSVSDYLFCEADRQLPSALVAHGCRPSHTWYFGRLSFDYYLHQAGFKNAQADAGPPVLGDFAVEEQIPREYSIANYLPAGTRLTAVDTLSFFRFPLRTKGLFAGFYGNDRLPYSWAVGAPQKEFVVYRIY